MCSDYNLRPSSRLSFYHSFETLKRSPKFSRKCAWHQRHIEKEWKKSSISIKSTDTDANKNDPKNWMIQCIFGGINKKLKAISKHMYDTCDPLQYHIGWYDMRSMHEHYTISVFLNLINCTKIIVYKLSVDKVESACHSLTYPHKNPNIGCHWIF